MSSVRRLPSVTAFYSTHIKYNVEQHHTVTFKRVRLFEALLLFFYCCRLANACFMFSNPQYGYYIQFDAVASFVYQNRLSYDNLFILAFIILLISVGIMQKTIYHSDLDCYTWKISYDFSVTAHRFADQCRLTQKQLRSICAAKQIKYLNKIKENAFGRLVVKLAPTFAVNGLLRAAAQLDTFNKLDFIDKQKLNGCTFPTLLYLNLSTKIKLIRLQFVLDMISKYCIIATALGFAFVGVYFFPSVLAPFPIWSWPVWCLEYINCGYIVYMVFRNAFIMNIGSFPYLVLFSEYLGQHYHQLEQYIARFYADPKWRIRFPRDITYLRHFLAEHTRMVLLNALGNKVRWSFCACGMLLAQVPINIIFLYRILFMKLLLAEKLITWGCIGGQCIILAAIYLSLAQVSASFHQAKKYLPLIQFILDGRFICLKGKLLALYERLESTRKYGLTLGFICVITKQSLMDVSRSLCR